MELDFEWDEDKALQNLHDHGVSFDEAKTVFGDTGSLTIFDTAHSINEVRWIDIGFSSSGRLLVVVYTERDTRIRLISSRAASAKERKHYEQRAD